MSSNKASTARPASHVEEAVLRLAREEPRLGQAAVAERLKAQGVQISASGVRYIWLRHGLETAVKRLQALAEEGEVTLTPQQRRLLERGQLSAHLAEARHADAGAAQEEDSAEGEPLCRQELILNVAAELFATKGYERTSMRDIARSVGLLPGSVYHHFPSKEELYLAIHREGFRRVMARVREAAAAGRDAWESLRLACEVHVSGMVAGAYVDRITGQSLAATGERVLFERIRPDRDAYEDVFRELIDALPVQEGTDRTVLRLTLLGAMNWMAVWFREGKRSPGEIADLMVAMLRDGVAVPAAVGKGRIGRR